MLLQLLLLLTNVLPTNVVAANSTSTTPISVPIMPFAKLFLDISKIEVFGSENFKRWQESIFSVLDMHMVTWVLTDFKTDIKC